jgi:hypothetical protein
LFTRSSASRTRRVPATDIRARDPRPREGPPRDERRRSRPGCVARGTEARQGRDMDRCVRDWRSTRSGRVICPTCGSRMNLGRSRPPCAKASSLAWRTSEGLLVREPVIIWSATESDRAARLPTPRQAGHSPQRCCVAPARSSSSSADRFRS